MSSKALPLLVDSRGNPISSRKSSFAPSFNSNRLIQSATQTTDRQRVEMLDKDVHRNVSALGRRTLMTLGRWLYSNFDVLRSGIDEMAYAASRQFDPQFYGQDKAWGRQTEMMLFEHDKICDIAGPPYNMATNRMSIIRSVLRDGDRGKLFVDNGNGYPFFQVIPSHRIRSDTYFDSYILDGEFAGYKLVDGVIVDDYGKKMGYRVVLGDGEDKYQDIPARDLFLSYAPEYDGQLRGFSQLGAMVFNMMDVKEARQFQLTAQKLAASIALIEKNETGSPDPNSAALGDEPDLNSSGGATTARTEEIGGVMARYFKAGMGCSLEAFENNNPSANSQAFEETIIRSAMNALTGSYDYAVNPTKVGGVMGRVVLDKVNQRKEYLMEHVLAPAIIAFDRFRISKFIELGLLPFNPEWWMFNYQGAGRMTSDEKYASDRRLQELRAGVTTEQAVCAETGRDWEEVQDQRLVETRRTLGNAKSLASEFGITIQEALTLLSDRASSSSITNSSAGQNDPEDTGYEPDP